MTKARITYITAIALDFSKNNYFQTQSYVSAQKITLYF